MFAPQRSARVAGVVVVAVLAVDLGAALGGVTAGGSHHDHLSIGPGASPYSTTLFGAAPTTTAPQRLVGAAGSRTPTTLSAARNPGSGGSGSKSSGSLATGAGSPDTAPTTAPSGGVTNAGRLPAPGTYTYDTSGYGELTIFGSTQKGNYPSRTPIKVAPGGCGETATWQPSSQSSQTVEECAVAGGLHIVYDSSTTTYDGQTSTEKFVCGSNSFIPITTGTVGEQWTFTCSSSDATANQTVTFEGAQAMTVAGQTVQTVKVRVVSTLSGAETGTVTSDYWFTSDATVVREQGAIDAKRSVATYQSQYSLSLVSLRPS